MELLSVFSKEFKPYGKVLSGYDTKQLLNALESSAPLNDGVDYVMSEPALETLWIANELENGRLTPRRSRLSNHRRALLSSCTPRRCITRLARLSAARALMQPSRCRKALTAN